MPDTTTTLDNASVPAKEAVVTDTGSTTPAVVATHPIPPWKIVLTRATRAAIQTFTGAVLVVPAVQSAASVPLSAPSLKTALLSALLSAAATFLMSALQNFSELYLNIDKNYPGFRA